MQAFRKGVLKSSGSNKIHPSDAPESQAHSTEPPRRRRQSFRSDVADDDTNHHNSTSQRTSSALSCTDTHASRPPSTDHRSSTPTSAARSASPSSPIILQRRSLSNGSLGGDIAGVSEQTEGQTSVKAYPIQHKALGQGRAKSASPAVAEEPNYPTAAMKHPEHIQSVALQRFFSSAQSSNSWSASSKKMIFGSDLDDSKLQNRAKLEGRCDFSPRTITFNEFLFRFEEDARNGVLNTLLQEGVADCCAALNTTLDPDGSCPAELDGKVACVPDDSLLVSFNTDYVVASNTSVYIQANAGRALVSLLSIFNVVFLTLFYITRAQYQLLLEHLERNNSLSSSRRAVFFELGTLLQFFVELFVLFVHLPPGDFESPVLVINSVFYGQETVLKYPWIALSSLFCTLRLYTLVRLARDITLAKWSSKKKLLERQSGITIDTTFAMKVMMAESPVVVIGGSFVFVWILCSYWMVVFERNHPSIRKYSDTVWLSFVTASTVGYGDLYPFTLAGRFVSVLVGFVGIIIAAFGTAALCSNLSLTNSEFKTKNLISRGDMDRMMCISAATYIQRYFRYKWSRPSPFASFLKPAIDMQSAANEFICAKRDYDVWLKSQVNLIISLKRMLEESEIIMKFTNFLSNDTGQSTKHFDLKSSGFDNLQQLELCTRDLRDFLKRMWNQAPASVKAVAEASVSSSSLPKTSGVEFSVDLSSIGNRTRSLSELCSDNNTDLESVCISVQRSGVGFVNPRAVGVQPQRMQQQENHSQGFTSQIPQQLLHTQPRDPSNTHLQPAHQMDFSATTQAVLQLANIKMMKKLVDAIHRIDFRGSDTSENSDDLSDEASTNESITYSGHSSRRPASALPQHSVHTAAEPQRPFDAAANALQRPRSSAGLMEPFSEQQTPLSTSHRGGRASSNAAPLMSSRFVPGDEARSRGARYVH